jgi:putative glycerol-1-phosphate prenyltransferase
MSKGVYAKLEYSSLTGQKLLAILIDPDDVYTDELLDKTIVSLSKCPPDLILIGGSLVTKGDIHHIASRLKKAAIAPLLLFPGDFQQLTSQVDATMVLSLISGRNPQYLIGEHVKASLKLGQMNTEILSTGYLLVDCGVTTSVEYMSTTQPIPYTKNQIACATALAGEQLGMKLIYLEGGSGAEKPIHPSMIRAVKSTLAIPLFVGGGIRSVDMAQQIWEAGADVIVVGTAFFSNQSILKELTELKLALN